MVEVTLADRLAAWAFAPVEFHNKPKLEAKSKWLAGAADVYPVTHAFAAHRELGFQQGVEASAKVATEVAEGWRRNPSVLNEEWNQQDAMRALDADRIAAAIRALGAVKREYRYVGEHFNPMAVCSACGKDATQTRMSFVCVDVIENNNFVCDECRSQTTGTCSRRMRWVGRWNLA